MHSHKLKAFTLVELGVAIVIVSILSTIWYISYGNYNSSARDSVRITDITNVAQWLVMQFSKNFTYPIPEDYITLQTSWVKIWYQWYIWKEILNDINMSSWKDPLDKIYYTYNTNIYQDKYQITGFLEDWKNINLSYNIWPDNAYSDTNDYSKRYPYTRWNKIWVVLSSWSETPINYNNTSTWYELTSSLWSNQIIFIDQNSFTTWTWTIIASLYTTSEAESIYPWCDTEDIELSNWQIWSACNVWATEAFTWINLTNVCDDPWCSTDPYANLHNLLWGYFQWWRDDDVSSSNFTWTLALSWTISNTLWHNLFIKPSSTPRDWIATPNINLWWASLNDTWAYDWQTNDALRKGPCANWYHVPSIQDWCSTVNTINPNLSCDWTLQTDYSIVSVLRLPFSGYRKYSDAHYYSEWNYWYYWISSTSWKDSYRFDISGAKIYPLVTRVRANWFSVRCIKDS